MRRIAFFLLVTLLTTSSAWAQKGRSGRHSGPFGFDLRGPFHQGFRHPGFFDRGPRRGGFFFGSPFFGPGIFAGPHFSVFPHRFLGTRVRLFSGPELADPDGFHFRAGPRGGGFYDPYYGGYAWPYSVPSSTQSFVEEWKDRDPRPQEPDDRNFSFSESLLLEEGMSKEQVMGLLGSPLRRIRLGSREVWRYSGYSLVFEQGSLKEMR
ncbi:MAG TPA: hypothetical protein VLV83_11875 [Acidobacteriota bacterium]|nr:hypothetical protein [Acidobacteriota bacterium]